MKAKACIEICNITKSFGSKTVLSDICLSVEKGEILGLLGPSGAGKTTLIKILTGQLKQEGGEAKILDKNVNKLSNEDYMNIGMVLDTTGLYERLSCYDNLVLYTDIYGISKKLVFEVLEQVQLQDAIKKPVSSLSKGMKQRLILARAILHSPKLLFLDEPTSGLDPKTAAMIHELIFKQKEKGTTIFLTTHNMEEATKLCDNVALLFEGSIVEYGEPKAICQKYNHQNKITINLNDNTVYSFTNEKKNANKIAEFFQNGIVKSIHSSEPNLEAVFMELTGRGFN